MKKYLFIVLLVGVYGCAHMAVERAKQDTANRINPLLGKNTEEIILALGMPTNTASIEGMEVWTYYRSYGSRGNVNANAYGTGVSGDGQTWESYDKITLYLKEKKFIKWDAYFQR